MKLRISIITALSLGLTGAALADSYDAWVAQGYRWVSAHGPYACTSKEGAQRITTDRSDATELDMVVHGQAYYLIPGTIVQVVEENQATGMSQVHMRGISPPLWTYSRFLSKRPVQNVYGEIETPENFGGTRDSTTSPAVSDNIATKPDAEKHD